MDGIELLIQPLNLKNVKIAGKIQYEIFPHSSSYVKYLEELDDENCKYHDFVIYYKDKPIGVIGYSLDIDDKDTVWLSWFGLLKEYRRRGLGTKALNFLCEMLKNKGYKILRLFTYEVWNSEAQEFYKKRMDFGEYYTNKDDNQFDINVGKCKIFTKALNNEKPPLWKNKFINIGEEDILNEKSIKKLKEDKVI